MKRLLLIILLVHLFVYAATAHAELLTKSDTLMVYVAPYVYHFNSDVDHNQFPWLMGMEWESASRWLIGGAFFKNSYDQSCGYIYGGKRWLYGSKNEHLFFKLTTGAIFGYVDPYEDKLPVNFDGIAPGIIPSIGYKLERFNTQLVVLAASGLMLTFGYDIWR